MEGKIKNPDIRHRLENDPIFRQTNERMIAEILDTPATAENGSAISHTLRFSSQLFKRHIDNLNIHIIDSYEAGNLRNFLIWHNGLRRLIEVGIESVHSDSVRDRIKDFSQRRNRAETIDAETEFEPDDYEPEDDPDIRLRGRVE